MSAPVFLVTPQFDKPLVLMVDITDLGVGSVLLQEDQQAMEYPIAYCSQKFNKSQRNYCTSEKETLALILVLQHFVENNSLGNMYGIWHIMQVNYRKF